MSKPVRKPSPEEQAVLESLQIRIAESCELDRCHQLLDEHHYLGSPKLVPGQTFPNLGSRSLRLALSRLSSDWQTKYGHPVLVMETFVDPEQFCGTVYTANGWEELGKTDGSGWHQRDYYVRHDKPKRLFVRELCRNARRSLQAEHLKPALARVEAKAGQRSRHKAKEIKSIVERLREVPDYRTRIGNYPLRSLLAIYRLAVLCDAPRGSKDLYKFARQLSQAQRRALGIRQRQGRYPAPSQPTFWRLLEEVNGTQLEEVLLQVQEQLRGLAPQNELIAMDGKEPKHGGGQSVLTAVCVPSQYYLGSAMVDTKTNEIPVAQKLTTTDFQAAMGEEHCRPAMRLLFAKQPSLKPP